MLLKNATIYDGIHAGPIQGDLALREGKIAAVGGDIAPLPGEEVMDVTGRRVYPGFIDAHSHLGLDNYGMGFEGHDYNEMGDILSAQLRAIDSFNPQDAARESPVIRPGFKRQHPNLSARCENHLRSFGSSADFRTCLVFAGQGDGKCFPDTPFIHVALIRNPDDAVVHFHCPRAVSVDFPPIGQNAAGYRGGRK